MKCIVTNLTSNVKQSDQNLTKLDYLNAWTFFPFIFFNYNSYLLEKMSVSYGSLTKM